MRATAVPRACLTLVLSLPTTAPAQSPANLVANGGFETGGLGTCNHNCHGGLPGWTSNSWCTIDWVRIQTCAPMCTPPFVAPEGHCIVDLSGSLGSPGTIWQPITLVPGKSYRLGFEFGGNCMGDTPTKRMSVNIGPVSREYTWNCATACYVFGPRQEIDFTATVASNTLQFTSLSNPNYGPMIDDVRLIELPTCPADINRDGSVSAEDLGAVLFGWGDSGASAGAADVNRNGIVDGNDLSEVLGAWGACPQ